jgi:hypothetical protein
MKAPTRASAYLLCVTLTVVQISSLVNDKMGRRHGCLTVTSDDDVPGSAAAARSEAQMAPPQMRPIGADKTQGRSSMRRVTQAPAPRARNTPIDVHI